MDPFQTSAGYLRGKKSIRRLQTESEPQRHDNVLLVAVRSFPSFKQLINPREPHQWQVKSHVIRHKQKYTQPSAHANECWR